jgi:hypothetical protein
MDEPAAVIETDQFLAATRKLFIFTMYAKNAQSDLDDAARSELKRITKSIFESYGKAGR